MTQQLSFKFLGQTGSQPSRELDTFPAPSTSIAIKMTSDEVTALCPITGQPDQYIVEVDYEPKDLCIESKSLKLYFHSFRNDGIFCEAFATQIVKDVVDAIHPKCVTVTVFQKARGGISIRATDDYYELLKSAQ